MDILIKDGADIHMLVSAQKVLDQYYKDKDYGICTVCDQRESEAVPNKATLLLHGMTCCETCYEWHRSDPHNLSDNCGQNCRETTY